MSKFKKIDISKVKTISIKNRKSKVSSKDFATVYNPKKESFNKFISSLPNILKSQDLKDLAKEIIKSRKNKKPVILMMGAHVIKVGLAPIIIELVEQKIITAIAINSAAAIHDSENALFGQTSEDVAENILDGSFGMSKETGDFINKTLKKYANKGDFGYGEALGEELILLKAANLKFSLLASCIKNNVPITVHAAIGTDIIHQQPTMDGGVTGEMSYRDFKIFTNVVKDLSGGGVLLNFGSSVIMPEIFLKALTIARNLGFKTNNFTTANFDMLRHYRPTMNVVQRPTQNGGRGFDFSGHHEIMMPLLFAMIKSDIK